MSIEAQMMRRALDLARQAATAGEVPIAAIITERATGKIIAESGNRTERDRDATAHAEILVIRAACQHFDAPRIPQCDLYVTLEPCTMCAGAIAQARVGRVIFAAEDAKGGGVLHGARFFSQPTCHHRPEIIQQEEDASECAEMLRQFFRARRKSGMGKSSES